MIVFYTEDEPERRLVSASGQSPKDRAQPLAVELRRLGFDRVGWLEDYLGVTEFFAVSVSLPRAADRERLPAEVGGFRLRPEGFDPIADPGSPPADDSPE